MPTSSQRVATVAALALAGLTIGGAWLTNVAGMSPALPGQGALVATLVSPAPFSADSNEAADAPPEHKRTQYTGLVGRVMDCSGAPVAGITVTCNGSATVSSDNGTFALVGDRDSRPRAVLPRGLVAVESPLLSLLSEREALLVVMPAAPLFGEVVDEQRRPVAGIKVSLELTLPLAAVDGVRQGRAVTARTVTDAHGTFALPDAPFGKGVTLVLTSPNGLVQRQARANKGGQQYILDAGLRPHSPAQAHPTTATRTDSARALTGTLIDQHGQPMASCWVSARPVAGAEARLAWAAPKSLPVCTDRSGGFTILDAPRGQVRFEAWWVDNRAVFRSAVTTDEDNKQVVTVKRVVMPANVHGRVVDMDGRPQAGVTVGLARPSGWGFEGTVAMLATSRVSTDRGGYFVLPSANTPALEICVYGHGIVPLRASIAGYNDARGLELCAMPRRWLARAQSLAAPFANAELVALDAAGCPMPIWGRQPTIARLSWPLRLRSRIALARSTRTIVLRSPTGECGWLELTR